jgi:hypothetical protein
VPEIRSAEVAQAERTPVGRLQEDVAARDAPQAFAELAVGRAPIHLA